MELKKLIFTILISIVIILIVVNLTSVQVTNQVLEKEYFSVSSQSLNLYNTMMGNALKEFDTLTLQIATDDDVQSYLGDLKYYDRTTKFAPMHDKIISYIAHDSTIDAIHIVDIYGNDTAHGVRNIGLTNSESSLFTNQLESLKGKTFWVSSETGEHFFCAREILNTEAFKFDSLGSIIARIDKSAFLNVYSKTLLSDTAPLMLITYADELVLSSNNEEMINLTENSSELIQSLKQKTNKHEGYFITKINLQDYFIAYLKDQNSSFTYYSLMPYDEITNTINSMKTLIYTLLIILLILLFIVSRVIANSLTKPIKELTTNMHMVVNGIYSTDEMVFTSKYHIHEINDMQESFKTMTSKLDYLINEIYKKQLLIEKTRFNVLQSQINPHFLYNTLTSINALARRSEQKDISTMVMALSNLLRESIDFKNELIPLKDELKLTKDFISIQLIRYPKRLHHHINIPESYSNYLVPKFSIQPLVENAIKYNINETRRNCSITISAVTDDQLLIITVEDNGIGMDANYLSKEDGSESKEKTGLGLKNIHHRIQMLFGESYGITIDDSRKHGTSIHIKLPITLNKAGVNHV